MGKLLSLDFHRAARAVAAEAHQLGLVVPAFRTPPASGETRTISGPPGCRVVSVAVAGRSVEEVTGDLVDGVLAVNGITGERARAARWAFDALLGA